MKRLLEELKRRNPLPDGAIPVGIGLVVTGLATYVVFSVAANALDEDAYAALGVLWALLFTVGNGVMQPLEQEVARAVADRRARGIGAGPIIRRASIIGLCFTVALTVATLLVAPWLIDNLFDGNSVLVVAFILGLLGFCIGHLVRGTLSSHGRFPAYGVFFGVDGVVRPLLGGILAVLGVTTLGLWGGVIAVAPFIASAVALRGQHGLVEPGPDASWTELTQKLGWLLLGTGSTALLINGGVIAVELLATPSQEAAAGIFLSGLLIARVPLFLFQAVLAGLLPKLSHLAGLDLFDEFASVLRRLCVALLALGIVAIAGAALVGPAIVDTFFAGDGVLGPRDLGLLTTFAVVLMVGVAEGQGVIALGGHGRMALGWLAAVIVFIGVTAAGRDLFLRVETGLVAAAAVAAVWQLVCVVERLRHHAHGGAELDLADAVAELPAQP
jgi:O-antigen/teichoic acid export membrane protein